MNCALCGKEASYKSTVIMHLGKKEHTSYYCKGCAAGGLNFGFLEPEELVKL